MTNVQQSDIGIIIEIDVGMDVSAATTKTIALRPVGAALGTEHAASFATDGADGVVRYVTAADDLAMVGTYQAQARVTFSNGNSFHSPVVTFGVLGNIKSGA